MYMRYNGTDYPCNCRPGRDLRITGLPDTLTGELAGTVEIYADDGFCLRSLDAGDFLRHSAAGGELLLSDTPEPEAEDDTLTAQDTTPTIEERLAALETAVETLTAALESRGGTGGESHGGGDNSPGGTPGGR